MRFVGMKTGVLPLLLSRMGFRREHSISAHKYKYTFHQSIILNFTSMSSWENKSIFHQGGTSVFYTTLKKLTLIERCGVAGGSIPMRPMRAGVIAGKD